MLFRRGTVKRTEHVRTGDGHPVMWEKVRREEQQNRNIFLSTYTHALTHRTTLLTYVSLPPKRYLCPKGSEGKQRVAGGTFACTSSTWKSFAPGQAQGCMWCR